MLVRLDSSLNSPMSSDSRPSLVLLSGICALIVSMGVARFAYTPILPFMQDQTGMGDDLAGWLAGWNYFGYLSGVLLASRLKDLVLKDRLYRIGLVLAVVTTGMMAISSDALLWGVSRYLAGLSSAAGLLLGSGLILNWLIRHNKRSELGLHFTGVGLGIIVGAVMVEMSAQHLDWQGQWVVLTLMAMMLVVPAWVWLPHPSSGQPLQPHHSAHIREPNKRWLWLLQAAYFCAGFGYVINATFTVVITEQQPALQGQGVLMWVLVGAAAAPATLVWDRVARRVGYITALKFAFLLQIVGILLPVFDDHLTAAVLSALLFGATFIGIVSLVLTMVGLLYPAHPAQIMAKLTLGYSVSQIVGPIIAGEAAEATGTFNGSLVLAGVLMVLGLMCLQFMSRYDTIREQPSHAR